LLDVRGHERSEIVRRSLSRLHYSGSAPRASLPRAVGAVAERIVETARDHNVPLQQDSALGRRTVAHRLWERDPARAVRRVAHVLGLFAWSVAGKPKL
jgi:flagellar biosynthesis protein